MDQDASQLESTESAPGAKERAEKETPDPKVFEGSYMLLH